MTYWEVLTHDFRPPLQGGDPIWDGTTLPFTLPKVKLDTSDKECAAGWNCIHDLATAFRIAGLWPTGRPSVALVVEPDKTVIHRGDKSRAEQLTIVRRVTEAEETEAIRTLSEPFGEHAERMFTEQVAWRRALAEFQAGAEL